MAFRLSFILSALISAYFTAALFFTNQILIWDDLVWFNSSIEQLRDVANQLGFWWLAGVNEWIYTLDNPNTFLTAVGFFSHLVAIYFIGAILLRLNILDEMQSVFWVACCIFSPFLLIRYTNSVAFYNLYLAMFSLALYLHISFKSVVIRIISAVLFFASFSLQSLIPAYFLFISFATKKDIAYIKDNALEALISLFSKKGNPLLALKNIIQYFRTTLKSQILYFILPFLFIAVKSFAPATTAAANPYTTYNFPKLDLILTGPFVSIFYMLKDLLRIPVFSIRETGAFTLLASSLVVFTVIFIAVKILKIAPKPRDNQSNGNLKSNIFYLMVLAAVLYWPYVLVGKAPVLSSFTDARHMLTAQPVMYAIILIVMSELSRKVGPYLKMPNILGFLSLSIFTIFIFGKTLTQGSNIWWHHVVNDFIVERLEKVKNSEKLWIFDAQQHNALSHSPYNYEYTGLLIKAFGGKDNFGISKDEYLAWNQPVDLLREPYFKERYNIIDYVHTDSFNEVVISQLKPMTPTKLLIIYLLVKHGVLDFKTEDFVSVKISQNTSCVDNIFSVISSQDPSIETIPPTAGGLCQSVIQEEVCKNLHANKPITLQRPLDFAYAIQTNFNLVREWDVRAQSGQILILNHADRARALEYCDQS